MKIFRATNEVSPMDKATLRELKAQLDKAVGKSEAEFKAAQKQYDDFVAKLKFDKPTKKTPEEAWSHFMKKNCKLVLHRKSNSVESELASAERELAQATEQIKRERKLVEAKAADGQRKQNMSERDAKQLRVGESVSTNTGKTGKVKEVAPRNGDAYIVCSDGSEGWFQAHQLRK